MTGPAAAESNQPLRGYLLTRALRDDRKGSSLTFWASTECGPVKMIVENVEPVMFVRRSAGDAAGKLVIDGRFRDVELRAMDGESVQAVYFSSQRSLEQARELLRERDIECLEADIAPAERYLMERFIRGSFSASGLIEQRDGYPLLVNPSLRHDDYRPRLAVMSFDIETSPDSRQLYSIAYICGSIRRVLMSGEPGAASRGDNFELVFCKDERELLTRFIEDVHALDPDVLVGWNVVNFDLSVLQKRCAAHKLDFALGRDRSRVRIIPRRGASLNAVARIGGRVVLDGIECLRSAFWTFGSYALDYVARELLDRGKAIAARDDKTGEIKRLFHEDKAALARYNIEDCQLVLDIFARTDLLEFVVERTRLTGLAMGRQGGSVAAFDYLYLPRLHRKGWVAPSLTGKSYPDSSPGGYVLDSVPGIHDNVAVLDFKSLYPSIIRTFKIDPLGHAQPGDDPIPGFLGASFSRDDNLLPDIIEDLWQRRDEAKRSGNQPLSQAIKILMNSFYGVLGTDGCRFYHPQLASSITRRGHQIIRTSRQWIEEYGLKVIYGDTDSLFVLLKDEQALEHEASDLVQKLNRRWTENIKEEYRLHSYLEIELETIFVKFFMPKIRGRDTGSKKRYAGMSGADASSLVIKGLEAVRSDWTDLARDFQRELLCAVFQGRNAEPLIHEYVARVRSEDYVEQLAYRKRLRQPLNAYRKNIPPHVKAARLLDKPGSEIRYYITTAGPQPAGQLTAPLDYDHYIERQIKPVADSILPFVGLDFDEVVGGQRDLFG